MRDELWIKHDVRSRVDPKMALFLKRHGMIGYGVFWALMEVLHYQNDHEIDIEADLPGLAAQFGVEDPIELHCIIEGMVECGLMLLDAGRHLFQARLKEEQSNRSKTKQKAGSLGGIKSGEIRREKARQRQLNENGAPEAAFNNSPESREESKQSEADQRSNEQTKLEEKREKRIDKILIHATENPAALIPENKPTKPKRGRPPKPPPPDVIKFGEHHLQMTAAEMAEIVAEFGEPLVTEQIPKCDFWIKHTDKPNGVHYRRPSANHFLMFKQNWMPRALKEAQSPALIPKSPYRNGSHASAADEANMRKREELLKQERQRLELSST